LDKSYLEHELRALFCRTLWIVLLRPWDLSQLIERQTWKNIYIDLRRFWRRGHYVLSDFSERC
jgi:hypothetical protein